MEQLILIIFLSFVSNAAPEKIKIGYTNSTCKEKYEMYSDDEAFPWYHKNYKVEECDQKYQWADKIEVIVDKAGMNTKPNFVDLETGKKIEPELKQTMTVKIWRNGIVVRTFKNKVSAGDANHWANEEILTKYLGKARRARPTDDDIARLEEWMDEPGNWNKWLKAWTSYNTPVSQTDRPFRITRDPERTQGHCVGGGYDYSGAPMPYSLFFKGGVALHSTTRRDIGQPGSHGCVSMDNEDAKRLYCLMRQKGPPGTKYAKSENWKRAEITVLQSSEPIPLPPRRPVLASDGLH